MERLIVINEQTLSYKNNDINNYTVIDQLIFMTSGKLKMLFEVALSSMIIGDRLTLKELIMESHPYQTKTISQNQKYIYRQKKHPKRVILLMEDNINNIHNQIKKAEQWARFQPNEILCLVGTDYTDHLGQPTLRIMTLEEVYLEYGDPTKEVFQRYADLTTERIISQVWGAALGWTFSAPPLTQRFNEANEGYWRKSRQQEEDLQGTWGWMGTQPLNKASDKEYKRQFAIATDQEVNEFYRYYQAVISFKGMALRDMLSPGWHICPYCKKVHKKCTPISENQELCTYCGSINPYFTGFESIEFLRMKEYGWDVHDKEVEEFDLEEIELEEFEEEQHDLGMSL